MNDVTVLQTDLPDFPLKRGKVRDVYDLGDKLAIVATDRISAFDWIMPDGIPGKGKLLTAMSSFWFQFLGEPNHTLSTQIDDFPEAFRSTPARRSTFSGRTVLVQKAKVIPFECVARGYILGSGWKEYREQGSICGIRLPSSLQEADRLPEPIFTPTTKAESGHDTSVSFDQVAQQVGETLARELRDRTLSVYRRAAEYAATRGILIADTKLEWGQLPDGALILVDEVLTPDSSRFWPAETYQPGSSPPSFDKQFLRDWLETTDWDKESPPPRLPAAIIAQTAEKYHEAYRRLTGSTS